VYRSGDPSAKGEAEAAQELLTKAGIRSILLGDDAPGVVEGSWEVRVPAADRERAEKLVDAPGLAEEERERDEEEVSEAGLSHDLDFVNLATFDGTQADLEATLLKAALEGSDIPVMVVGSAQIPSLGFEVRVPKTRLEEALTLMASADQSGAEIEGESE